MRKKWTEIWVESAWNIKDVEEFVGRKLAIGGM